MTVAHSLLMFRAASGSRPAGGVAPGRASSSNGATPAAAAAPKQKAGKVVFAGGNRLAAKQAAAKEQKVRDHHPACGVCQSSV